METHLRLKIFLPLTEALPRRPALHPLRYRASQHQGIGVSQSRGRVVRWWTNQLLKIRGLRLLNIHVHKVASHFKEPASQYKQISYMYHRKFGKDTDNISTCTRHLARGESL